MAGTQAAGIGGTPPVAEASSPARLAASAVDTAEVHPAFHDAA